MRRVLAGVALLLIAVAAWLAYRLNDRPSMEKWPRIAATGATGVSVRFLGVSSLVVSDGTTALVIDGFVSRPSLWRTFAARIAPDVRTIDWVLDRVELRGAAAVIVVHSHYDHAMDAPLVALRTGALLVGSPSTANIARGLGFPEDRLRPADGTSIALGAFRVTTIRSRHFPHGMAMGEISAPLVPPARVSAYREGGSYSVLIEHPMGTLLVQGSAGWEEGALTGRRADVVLLGIAGLGTRGPEYTERYLGEVVDAVRPRLVVPIHWDDFSRPLMEPLVPLPRLLDDVGLTMRRLADHVASRRVRMAVLPTFDPVVLLPRPGRARRPLMPPRDAHAGGAAARERRRAGCRDARAACSPTTATVAPMSRASLGAQHCAPTVPAPSPSHPSPTHARASGRQPASRLGRDGMRWAELAPTSRFEPAGRVFDSPRAR